MPRLRTIVGLFASACLCCVISGRCGATDSGEGVVLWPEPKKLTLLEGSLPLAGLAVRDVAGAPNTLSLLRETLRRDYAFEFDPDAAGELIIARMDSAEARRALAQWNAAPPRMDLPEDGFLLAIRPGGILVAGTNDRGVYYAIRALLAVVDHSTPAGAPPRARCMDVTDWPDQKMRALFWRLDSMYGAKYSVDMLKEYIGRVVAGSRYNAIVFMMRGGVQYKSHPEISRQYALTQEEFKDLVAFCRQNYIEPIPATNTPGHAEWLIRGFNEHLAEQDNATLCTRNPDALKLIRDINQEMIDLCGGKGTVRFFHVGRDEVRWPTFDQARGIWKLGHPGHKLLKKDACALCRDVPRKELLLEYIQGEHEWFAARGIRMMMWADMFAEKHNGPKFDTTDLSARMPKDILLIPWSALDYGSIARWAKEGHAVIKGATGYKILSIGDDVASGYMLAYFTPSPWLTFTSTRTSSHNYYNHMSTLVYANYAWNNDPTLVALNEKEMEDLKTTVQVRGDAKKLALYRERGNTINRCSNRRRSPAATGAYVPISLDGCANRDRGDCFGAGKEYGLSELQTGTLDLAGVKTEVGAKVLVPQTEAAPPIPVNLKAASLLFLHTAFLPEGQITDYRKRIMGSDEHFNMTAHNNPVGCYQVRYDDGSQEAVTINYGLNVFDVRPPLHSRFPYDVRYVYTAAKDASQWHWTSDPRDLAPGAPALYQYQWINPRPEKTILSVTCVSLGTEVAPALVALTVEKAR